MSVPKMQRYIGIALSASIIFFFINVLAYRSVPTDKHLAPDSQGYIVVAQELEATGNLPFDLRLPGYPYFLSFLYGMPVYSNLAVVAIQTVVIFIGSICAACITKHFLPDQTLAGFVIALFLPYGFYASQVILPEAMFSLIFSLHALLLIQAYTKLSWTYSIASGIFAGALALTRGNGLCLIWGAPLILVAASICRHKSFQTKKCIVMVILFLASSLAVLSPWLALTHEKTKEFAVIPPKYRQFAVYEMFRFIECLAHDYSDNEAAKAVNDKIDEVLTVRSRQALSAGNTDRYALAYFNFLAILQKYQISELFLAFAKSMVSHFFSTGYTALRHFFVFERPVSIFVEYVLMLLVLCLRFLNVAAAYFALRDKDYEIIIFSGGYIFIFTLATGFFGMARYRYPIDFLFIVLALYGYRGLLKCKFFHFMHKS